jgi:type IV pilus assembly protein PilW
MTMDQSQCFVRSRRAQHGLSLIELMVALVISSILTLAIFGVMSTFEGRKRTTTTMNDTNQAGSYAVYLVDKYIRSAGSGIAQAGPEPGFDDARKAMAYGCRLLVSKSGTTVLPKGSALASPFENVIPTTTAGMLRLAPVIIVPSASSGQGFNGELSDVLLVMAGTGGFGDVPIPLTAPMSASTLAVSSGLSLVAGDLLLLADQKAPTLGTAEDCMIQQVAGTYTAGALSVGLGGAYAAATIASVTPAIYDENSVALKLGHSTLNPPNFLAIGVGANRTLFSYDLLETRSPALQAISDNVFELHAIYGVDTDANPDIDRWVDPRTTSDEFQMSRLMDGSKDAANSIAKIKAVRVAMILRTSLQEKAGDATSTPASYELFSGFLTTPRTRSLTTDERRFRYRVIELTIPVRNGMLAPRPA